MDASSRQAFEALSRFVPEPLLLLSAAEGHVRLANRAARELLERDGPALEGLPLAELLSGGEEDARSYLRMCARSVQPLPGAVSLRRASGAPVSCRVKGALLLPPGEQPAGCPAHVLWRLEPGGGAPSAFSLLTEKVTHLTREVMNRKRAEQEALDALGVRDEFLAVASHELRTPLHAFNLQLELAARALRELPEAAQRLEGRLGVMRRQLERMSALSTSLLDVSQLRAGALQLRLQPVDLGEAASAATERMGAEFERAGCHVRLDLQPGAVVLADPSRVDQVLVNLMSNAAKYGAGKPVEVSARLTAPRWASVSVRDQGIGIAQEDLARLFGRFERLGTARHHYGGLGLGLYVSRQLATAMGGSLEVASALGQGSTFTLQLPR
jgi:signal transduction histidine kinase